MAVTSNFSIQFPTSVSLLIQLCLSNSKSPLFVIYAILSFAGSVQYATISLKMSPKTVVSVLSFKIRSLAGCTKHLLSGLKKVQNNAARLIFRFPRSAHVTRLCHSFHWFPVQQRIENKLSLLCFKSISAQAPTCSSDHIHFYTPSRQVRSSEDTGVFRIPSFRTKSSGQRSFSYQASSTWNQLPASICHAFSITSFKSSLNANLFSQNFFQIH